MAHKQILFRSAAREEILRGTTQLADAVRVTLGPRSKSVLIEKKWAYRSSAMMASPSRKNSTSRTQRRISAPGCFDKLRKRLGTWWAMERARQQFWPTPYLPHRAGGRGAFRP